jgi:hypothetical protein
MDTSTRKLFNKVATKVIPKFAKLEKEFGVEQVRYAMRKYLVQNNEELKRKKEIAQLERELEQLKRKRL